MTRNRLAERITDLSSNPKNHANKLANLINITGLASLQNTIILATSLLSQVPSYGHRELLIVYNSISTCDPTDIFATINEAIRQKIRISIICQAGELHICRKITELTGGMFFVSLDSQHMIDIFQSYTVPPPEKLKSFNISDSLPSDELYTDFIYMGFPKRTFHSSSLFLLSSESVCLSSTAYQCPRCHTRTSDLPTDCKVCRLQLNSSANIARSYHHLFPVNNYIEFSISNNSLGSKSSDPTRCIGCLQTLSEVRNLRMVCPTCSGVFCVDCDLFIHESLHNCPGCASLV